MTPTDYDGWYDTPRGRWIGNAELRLLTRLLEPKACEELLDVGCGTGWFTRRLAALPGVRVTGLDPNAGWLRYARLRDPRSCYLEGDARALPFAEARFDHVVSVTALCFIPDWQLAVREMVRIARKRVAIGVLNRRSLLWRNKGQGDGSGAYAGAHWYDAEELRDALAMLPVKNIRFHSAVFRPSGSALARLTEVVLPNRLLFGGLLVVSCNKAETGVCV